MFYGNFTWSSFGFRFIIILDKQQIKSDYKRKKVNTKAENIHFTVFHDSLTSRREQLGTLMINSASKGNDYTQWKNMIDGKKSIGWWHNLSNQLDNNNNNNNNYKNSSSSASSSFKINKRSLNFSSLKIK